LIEQLELPGLWIPRGYHDFATSLQFADANSSILQLELFYRHCFDHVETVEKVMGRKLQRQGIDTILTLSNGKQIYMDEKIRENDYGDILLEEFSVWRNYPLIHGERIGEKQLATGWRGAGLKPGWVSGNKKTDYIVYVVKPSRRVFFLPFLLLQRAWKSHYTDWLEQYKRIAVKNNGYVTTNIPIPTDILYRALFESAQWVQPTMEVLT
jgi:hypothetical protein